MMSFGVWLGRVIFAGLWAVLLANLVWPFPGSAFPVFLLLLGILVLMHLMQLAMFVATYRQTITWRRGDYWQIFFFGIVGWLALMQRQQRLDQQAPPKQQQD